MLAVVTKSLLWFIWQNSKVMLVSQTTLVFRRVGVYWWNLMVNVCLVRIFNTNFKASFLEKARSLSWHNKITKLQACFAQQDKFTPTHSHIWSKLNLPASHVILERLLAMFQFGTEKSIHILKKTQRLSPKQLYHLKGKFICWSFPQGGSFSKNTYSVILPILNDF